MEHGVNKPNCYLAPEIEEWEEEFLYYGGWFWLSLIIIMIIIWSFSNNILFPCKDNCRFNLKRIKYAWNWKFCNTSYLDVLKWTLLKKSINWRFYFFFRCMYVKSPKICFLLTVNIKCVKLSKQPLSFDQNIC